MVQLHDAGVVYENTRVEASFVFESRRFQGCFASSTIMRDNNEDFENADAAVQEWMRSVSSPEDMGWETGVLDGGDSRET